MSDVNPFPKMKAKLKVRYESDIATLERAEELWLMENCQSSPTSLASAAETEGEPVGGISQIDLAERILPALKSRFTWRDVDEALRAQGKRPPRNTLAGIMRKLEERKAVVVIERGKGRRASVYRRSEEAKS